MRYLIVCLVLLITLYPTVAVGRTNPTMQIPPSQSSTEVNIFFDDFESYPIGSFPSQGPWQSEYGTVVSGQGQVTNTHVHSGSKSLEVTSGIILRKFDTQADQIGYEVAFYAESSYGNDWAHVSFDNAESQPQNPNPGCGGSSGCYWGVAAIDSTGMAIVGQDDKAIASWQRGVWYIVKVIFTKSLGVYSVWINRVLMRDSIKARPPNPQLADAISLDAPLPGIYFDDVRVFTVSQTLTAPTSSLATSHTGFPNINSQQEGLVSSISIGIALGLLVSISIVIFRYRKRKG